MRRKVLLLWLVVMLVHAGYGQNREVHILAANDMHAAVDNFPQLAAIADSLRALYPSLLVLSAGDNRTGNPVNDIYEISSYPMVALMNQVGFDATTLGNHEFDVNSLPPLMGFSNFSYVCANIYPSDDSGLYISPTKVFDIDGMKIGIIGVVQVNQQGRPDTHPDNVKGIKFSLPMNTISQYEKFSHVCDATILLSHLGYEDDIKMAKKYPWLDLIIGGHTHTQLTADEPLHNGVLITQNKNKLTMVTHITLTIKNGRVRNKKAEYIPVSTFPRKNRLVEAMVVYFNKNPYFERLIAEASKPFKKKDELNFLMCDALLEEGKGEISIVNNGGVRLDSLSAGPITMREVLSMDPFNNVAVEMDLTGEDILKILTTYSRGSLYHLPRVGGILCEATIDKDDKNKDRLKNIRLMTLDGSPFDMERTYKVITNSYMSSICQPLLGCPVNSLNTQTADVLARYLKKQVVVSPRGLDRLKIIEK